MGVPADGKGWAVATVTRYYRAGAGAPRARGDRGRETACLQTSSLRSLILVEVILPFLLPLGLQFLWCCFLSLPFLLITLDDFQANILFKFLLNLVTVSNRWNTMYFTFARFNNILSFAHCNMNCLLLLFVGSSFCNHIVFCF